MIKAKHITDRHNENESFQQLVYRRSLCVKMARWKTEKHYGADLDANSQALNTKQIIVNLKYFIEKELFGFSKLKPWKILLGGR